MTTDVITSSLQYEEFQVAVAKLALLDSTSREQAAANIAGRALLGELTAVGVKLADPMQDEEQSDERQPIPAGAWADFQSCDYEIGIIRVRAGKQLRALALWRDIHMVIDAPASEPRSKPANISKVTAAKEWLIELRQADKPKPGGNAAGLTAVLHERFGLTKHQAENVAKDAREQAPNPNWDAAGRPSKTFPKPS